MQEILALLILAVIAVFVVFPAIGGIVTSGNTTYLGAMATGSIIVGVIATVVGGVIAGAWALDTLGIIDSPRF